MFFKSLPIPKIQSNKILYEEAYLKLEVDKLLLPDNQKYDYYKLCLSPGSVMVLAQTPEKKFVLNREYRHPVGKYILGTPGGIIDPHESAIEAGPRELLEETGFVANNFQLIGESYSFPGIVGQKAHFLFADNAHPLHTQKLELSELVYPILLSWEEIQLAIAENVELDGLLCSALFFYQRFINKD